MTISEDSQLGLRFKKQEVKTSFLKVFISKLENEKSAITEGIKLFKSLPEGISESDGEKHLKSVLGSEYTISGFTNEIKIGKKIRDIVSKETKTTVGSIQSLIQEGSMSKYFFICESVYKASELIKIGENFTGRTLKDIKHGHYTYLMGKNTMIRFLAVPGAILGLYWDDKKNHAFEFGVDLETGEYYAPMEEAVNFSVVMQLMTFIELGDIEVTYINALSNNGKPKKDGKVYNASNNTVFVVDSSWNKLLIRTDGFAVRGHFRLQPCGDGMKDRKLIWIDAFEKHGYTRRPKGEIINKTTI